MIFETKRLYATRWQQHDLRALHQLYNDIAFKEFIFPQPSLAETRQIFKNQLSLYNTNFPFGRYFIVEKFTDQFIGILLFRKDNKRKGVEIGYSLIRDEWNKGYATEIVRASIGWLFEQDRFLSISAITELHNENSKNVLLKCGFQPEENFIENGKEMNLFGILKEDISVFQ
ncbi:MAG TPA: GNAT family N-acetyltransferase [Ginsengibacter sp.]